VNVAVDMAVLLIIVIVVASGVLLAVYSKVPEANPGIEVKKMLPFVQRDSSSTIYTIDLSFNCADTVASLNLVRLVSTMPGKPESTVSVPIVGKSGTAKDPATGVGVSVEVRPDRMVCDGGGRDVGLSIIFDNGNVEVIMVELNGVTETGAGWSAQLTLLGRAISVGG